MNNFGSILKKELKDLKKELDPFIYRALKKHGDELFHDLNIYQLKTGGKRLRPFILLSIYELLGGEEKPLNEAAAIEIFHNYSLLLDDIIDKGTIRRGEATMWRKFGLSATLCSSSFYFSTITDLLKYSSKEAVDLFVKETKQVMEGEFIDVLQERASSNKEAPDDLIESYGKVDYDGYLKMIKKKTAALFRASCGMGAVLAGRKKDLPIKFGNFLGISYQLRDDILDIFGNPDTFGKEKGKDIKEKKGGNIVLIYAIEENPEIKYFFSKNNHIGDKEVDEIISAIKKTKAKRRTQDLIGEYTQKALKILDRLPAEKSKKKMENLVRYFQMRRK